MTRLGAWRAAALAAACLLTADSVRAATLYREEFETDNGTSLASVGWDGTNIGVDNGSGVNSAGVATGFGEGNYHWWFNNTTLELATNVTEMSYTTELTPIDSATPMLNFAWEQRMEQQFDDSFGDASGTGNGPLTRIAIQVGGTWYATAATFPNGNTRTMTYTPLSLAFSPAASSWRVVNGVDATPGVSLGAFAGSALTGNITGVGFVMTFSQQQTVNLNFLEINNVPEPATLGLRASRWRAPGAAPTSGIVSDQPSRVADSSRDASAPIAV